MIQNQVTHLTLSPAPRGNGTALPPVSACDQRQLLVSDLPGAETVGQSGMRNLNASVARFYLLSSELRADVELGVHDI